MRFFKQRRGMVLALTILVIACIPSYVRAFMIAGDSDAPAFVTGDRVLVNFAAYDIRLPFTRTRLVRLDDPSPGDVVLFQLPDGRLMMKRVVAGPGTRIAMRDSHLTINGVALKYAAVTQHEKPAINRGRLGETVEIEEGNGPRVYISFSRGRSGLKDFEEEVVPQGHYFVLGSNREESMDSRQLGTVPRERVLGKVIGRIWSAA